jgi:hypothetical protein
MSSAGGVGRTVHDPVPAVRPARLRRGADHGVTAITVDNSGESLRQDPGPFVEAPEYLGGFWIIDVADEQTALDWAARASKALGGRIEVRAFQSPPEN